MDEELLFSTLLRSCQEGELGLWAIIWEVRFALNNQQNPEWERDQSTPVQVRHLTMQMVRRLLVSGQVQAGYYGPDGSGVTRWNLPPDEIVKKIETEWDSLDRDPNIGEVVLFLEAG
jgi:hypothetical protein